MARDESQTETRFSKKEHIVLATVGRGGVIGRSLGLRSAINHSRDLWPPLLVFFLLNGPNRYSGTGRSLEGPWKDPYLLRTSSTCQLILLAALNLAFSIATAIFSLFARLYDVFPPVSIFPLPIFHVPQNACIFLVPL